VKIGYLKKPCSRATYNDCTEVKRNAEETNVKLSFAPHTSLHHEQWMSINKSGIVLHDANAQVRLARSLKTSDVKNRRFGLLCKELSQRTNQDVLREQMVLKIKPTCFAASLAL
jgi:hypothetical protein